MKRIFISIFILSSLINCSFSQTQNLSIENELNALSDSIYKLKMGPDSLKKQISDTIYTKFSEFLTDSSSFYLKFANFKHIGITSAPDNAFRLIQWNYIEKDGTGKHFGIIQFRPGNNGKCLVVKLSETQHEINRDELILKRMSPQQWYGALYYKIIPIKNNKTTIYTLLGTRYNSIFTTSKVIETLQIRDDGKIIFGYPILNVATKKNVRMIFEYSNKASMGLKYYDSQKAIVFDHLAPDQPLHTNIYKYYGPDFTYDAFKMENNSWVFYSNYDFRQPIEEIRKGPKPKIIRSK